MDIKTIGVLTSGGDAPGMNAAVRAVVRTAIDMGLMVKAIRRGYQGLIENDLFDADERTVSGIINRGGTVLCTARCPEFETGDGLKIAVENCKKNGIDGIVVIGGDGSYRGARDLSGLGVPCVGVPGTIDNDISSTDFTIGFDTAVNTAMEMIDRLNDTAQSHCRCNVVEVMGRRAGYMALHTGIAVGATVVLVPEIEFDMQRDVIDRIKKGQELGKTHFAVVVAEGVGNIQGIADSIAEACNIETRATVLGHVQRGGIPTLRDRVLASNMGYKAVEVLAKGIGNRVICINDNKIVDKDIFEALNEKKSYEYELHKIAHAVSI